MKILNKRELQQIAFNHSSDIDFKDFMNPYKNYTAKPYSFLVINTAPSSHNSSRFRENLSLHEKKCRKDHIFVCFRLFPFHGNIIFSYVSFKQKCKKAASFRKCVYSCVNMKFSYMIPGCKDVVL